MSNEELMTQDLAMIFHPCSQMKDYEKLPLIPIKSAKGSYIEDFDGNRYLDSISSWWVNLFGHCHPYINQCLQEQIGELEHVIFAGFSHKPAIDLARRLLHSLPNPSKSSFLPITVQVPLRLVSKWRFTISKTKVKLAPFSFRFKTPTTERRWGHWR